MALLLAIACVPVVKKQRRQEATATNRTLAGRISGTPAYIAVRYAWLAMPPSEIARFE